MRIIKFRAWDKVNKNMLYDVSTGTVTIWYKEISAKSENCVFMQYTGLKDATGKEIYEGDIVVEAYKGEFSICLTTFEKKPLKSGTYEVKWNKIGFNLGSEDGRDYEVIGNIYEFPKLFERKNNG